MTDTITQLGSSDRANWMRAIEAAVRRLVGKGIATPARFLTSLRVGSGAATLAAFDNLDGVISADGASAVVFFRDRALNTRWAGWYENDTVRLTTQPGGDIWMIDKTSGLITQDALAAISAGTNVTLNPVGLPTSGTRILKPDGLTICYFSMTAGVGIGAASTIGTITTAAHRPTGAIPFTMRDHSTGGAIAGAITSAGLIVTDAGLTNTHLYGGVAVY